MKKLVIISGVAGMSGNETARQLLKKNYFVIGFDNFFASSINSLKDILDDPNFTFFDYDICNSDHMLKLENRINKDITINRFDSICFINYAAVVHTKYFYEPESTFNTNVLGMKSFLDMAIKFNASSYINCSTSEVYSLSSYKEGGVSENDPLSLATAELSMRTSYATGKIMTEFFLKDAVSKGLIKGCSIRFANVYSNDELMPEHIIPYAIETLIKGDRITLLENARTTYRTFLHNFDSCSAVIALLEKDSALDGSIYNVGTDEEIYIPDLIQLIANELGIKLLKIDYSGQRSADPKRRLLNISKIKEKTGWSPKISLIDGIKMCIDYKRNH